MFIPKYWCGDPLTILVKNSLLDDGWFMSSRTGSKRMSVTNYKESYENKIRQDFGIEENFAKSSEIDVFASKDDICLSIEIKTRMYAQIRWDTKDYQVSYNSLHSRYHFDRYPEAISTLLHLKKNPTLSDDRHETVRSSCELLRYCLGLIQVGYMDRNCMIVVLMPFYAKEIEFQVVEECMDRLRRYVSDEYEFDVPMAIWKINTDSLDQEVPQRIWIERVYRQDGFNIPPPKITHTHIQNSLQYWRKYKYWKECGECKYRSLCEQGKGG